MGKRSRSQNSGDATVPIALRIPGRWKSPWQLTEQMPADCRLTRGALILPNQAKIELSFLKADTEFPGIFASILRAPATDRELRLVNHYTVTALLRGPGGSPQAARTMMEAGAAMVRAGGAGVFIENCVMAHGGKNWLRLTQDGSPDALTHAFVAIASEEADLWSLGMHALGFPDVVVKKSDPEQDIDAVIDAIEYLTRCDRPVFSGDVMLDLKGRRYRVFSEACDKAFAGSLAFNPFGRLRLVSVGDVSPGR